jgi:uncharacterized protein YjdB
MKSSAHRVTGAAAMAFAAAAIVAALSGCPQVFGSRDNPADPSSSSYQGYTVVGDPALLSPIGPAEGAVFPATTTEIPILVTAVAGAFQYEVQVAATGDFAAPGILVDIVQPTMGATKANSFPVPVSSLTSGALFWRARASSQAHPTWGAWTPARGITLQTVKATSIAVSGSGGASAIAVNHGTLQMLAAVAPTNATIKSVDWSVSPGTGRATISATGLLSALSNGTVTVTATARDGSLVTGAKVVALSNQIVPVTGIVLSTASGDTVITVDRGTLQLFATAAPTDATDKTVTWSVVDVDGHATISASGLLTAVATGAVNVIATANDGSGVSGSLVIDISGQIVRVASIAVSGAGGVATISNGATLQMSAAALPANAANKAVAWSVADATGHATIAPNGLLSALSNGSVTVRADATDGSGVYGTLVIYIGVPVTSVSVTGSGGATGIASDNGTLQMLATVLPSNASDASVTWSVSDGTGHATINAAGLLAAVANGTVIVKAASVADPSISGTATMTLSNQVVAVSSISVTGAGGATTVSVDKGTLQMSASVTPSYATNPAVNWSVVDGTGHATISASGLMSAVGNGTVTAVATAKDGSGAAGSLQLTLSNQVVPVASIVVSAVGGSAAISTDNGTLQMIATASPSYATNKAITWTVASVSGQASISGTGLLTAIANGNVTVTATASDGSGTTGSLVVALSNQVVPVSSIAVSGAGGATAISTNAGTLQMAASATPAYATNTAVAWSVADGTGHATISPGGLLTAATNGTVTVTAAAQDGSGVHGSAVVTISGQTTVYTAGFTSDGTNYAPCYWAGTNKVALPGATQIGYAESVFVDSGSVYVAGYYCVGPTSYACYWKDGQKFDLPGANSTASSIYVSGGKVYIAGRYDGSSTGIGCYWVDGIKQDLPVANANYYPDYPRGIFVVGSVVYVCGNDQGSGYYWSSSSGAKAYLSGNAASPQGIFVSGGVVYSAGAYFNGSYTVPCYWTGAVKTDLDGGTSYAGASSIFVSGGGTVYVGGNYYSGTSRACYWTGTTRTPLSEIGSGSRCSSIVLFGTSVYCAGYCASGSNKVASYWKDGARTDLALTGTDDEALSVFVQ